MNPLKRLIQVLFFTDQTALMRLGNLKPLEIDDIPDLQQSKRARALYEELERADFEYGVFVCRPD